MSIGDHPHTDPGDGRTECDRCGKFVFPAIHSCKRVPVTAAARARAGLPAAMPGDDTHTIVVRVTPTISGQVAVSIRSTHPDQNWTARALQLAVQAAQIREDGPAITTAGHLVVRETTPATTLLDLLTQPEVNP